MSELIVVAVLVANVAIVGAFAWMHAKTNGRLAEHVTKDKANEVLANSLKQIVDRLVVKDEEQLDRIKEESRREVVDIAARNGALPRRRANPGGSEDDLAAPGEIRVPVPDRVGG